MENYRINNYEYIEKEVDVFGIRRVVNSIFSLKFFFDSSFFFFFLLQTFKNREDKLSRINYLIIDGRYVTTKQDRLATGRGGDPQGPGTILTGDIRFQ